MAPRDDLEREYNQLTDRQKAIVDARVQNPNVPKTKISSTYAPQIYNEHYADGPDDEIDELNNSYVTQVLNGRNNELIPEIVDYKQDITENQRQQGEMTTTGDPFSASPHMDDQERGWQTWEERPNKEVAQRPQTAAEPRESPDDGTEDAQPVQLRAPVAARVEDDAVHVLLDKQYFKALLESQALPPELHKQLMEDILSDRLS